MNTYYEFTYAPSVDMTFILKHNDEADGNPIDTTVIGFVYGDWTSENEETKKQLINNASVKAEYLMGRSN